MSARKGGAPGLALAVALLAAGAPHAPAQTTAWDGARWYIGTYADYLLVWDEETEQVVDTIRTRNPIPRYVGLNEKKTRLYVGDASLEKVEIIDVERGESIDEISLSEDSVQVRVTGLAVDPEDRYAIMTVKRYERKPDRYVVRGPFIVKVDLATKRVTDTIPWPDGEEREGVGLRFSPDGEVLYMFTDDVIAVDPDTWEEVDRWKLSRPLEPGLGRVGVGLFPGTYDPEGSVTGLFRTTDPAQNRRLMGIATVRLAEKEVDFYTLGPSEPIRGFALAPDGRKAWALLSEVGRYEFWEFDLEGRRVARRVPFAGRPRMGLRVSHDGSKLYVYVAGNTIDIYDAATFQLLRTVALAEDMTGVDVLPTRGPPGS